MDIKLIKPTRKYLPSVKEAIAEYKAKPSDFAISAVKSMIAAADEGFADYFEILEEEALGRGLPQNYVAHTVYWLVDGDKYIGTFDLRHSLTEASNKIGGNIAYQIRPSEYRKGYVSGGLQLCLVEARKKGIEKALLTCKSDNIASYAAMCKAMRETGGYEIEPYKEDDIVVKRVWLYTSRENS